MPGRRWQSCGQNFVVKVWGIQMRFKFHCCAAGYKQLEAATCILMLFSSCNGQVSSLGQLLVSVSFSGDLKQTSATQCTKGSTHSTVYNAYCPGTQSAPAFPTFCKQCICCEYISKSTNLYVLNDSDDSMHKVHLDLTQMLRCQTYMSYIGQSCPAVLMGHICLAMSTTIMNQQLVQTFMPHCMLNGSLDTGAQCGCRRGLWTGCNAATTLCNGNIVLTKMSCRVSSLTSTADLLSRSCEFVPRVEGFSYLPCSRIEGSQGCTSCAAECALAHGAQ